MTSSDRPLPERLMVLAAFLIPFEQPDFKFGEWIESLQKGSGAPIRGGYVLSDAALSFIGTAYEMGWMIPDFDWPNWMESDEAIRLRNDPAAIAAATPGQLGWLLTALIRQDRFVEGALGGAYESGLLTAILRRAVVLVEELRGASGW